MVLVPKKRPKGYWLRFNLHKDRDAMVNMLKRRRRAEGKTVRRRDSVGELIEEYTIYAVKVLQPWEDENDYWIPGIYKELNERRGPAWMGLL